MRASAKTIFAVAAALFVLVLFVPFVPQLFKSSAASTPPLGELEASTMYQTSGGQLRMLRVLRSAESASSRYQVLHNDIQARALLGEIMVFEFPRVSQQVAPQFQTWSDGGIHLLLDGLHWLRFDAQRGNFERMNDALGRQFPSQLAVGIAKIAFGAGREPDMLDVTSNTGDRYSVYWLTGQIMPYGDNLLAARQRPFAQYRDSRQVIDFADFRKDGQQLGLPTVLVRYQQKVRAGEYQIRPSLTLRNDTDAQVLAAPRLYQPASADKVVDKASLQQAGITAIERVKDQLVMYSGKVLARNAQRVLISHELTPTTAAEEELMLLDATTQEVVWRRSTRQIAPAQHEYAAVEAHPMAAGFYLTAYRRIPALAIDNDGRVLNDFKPREVVD